MLPASAIWDRENGLFRRLENKTYVRSLQKAENSDVMLGFLHIIA